MMRLAHFSDIHCTINPFSDRWRRILGKRLMGSLNYFVGGRRKHFNDSTLRIEKLLADADAQSPDHVLCTGDVTQMSFEQEFEQCASLFGDRLQHPQRYTVLPGNHDRYTKRADAERRFEKWFGPVCESGAFPFVKSLHPNISLMCLDPCRATSMTDSSGLLGEEQLMALQERLTQLGQENQFVILALHYAVYRRSGQPDKARHGLQDFRELAEIIESSNSPVRMVLHGHIHGDYRYEKGPCTYLCAGSATDLYGACGYNIYEIDPEDKSFEVSRRVWNPSHQVYNVQG